MQVLIAYDIGNHTLRDGFRMWLEKRGFVYIQESLYSQEFDSEDDVKVMADAIKETRDLFGKWDDVRIFRIDHHWYPIERERIRFFED